MSNISIEDILKFNNNKFTAPAKRYNKKFSIKKTLRAKSSPDDLSNDINESGEYSVGATIYVLNNKTKRSEYATNLFYLTDFNFSSKERSQVINSINEPIVSFFDESVKIYTFQGIAPEAASNDVTKSFKNFQHSSLVNMYNKYLRGTELVRNNRIAVMVIGNHKVYGYPLNLNNTISSSRDKVATFSMSWVVADHIFTMPNIITSKDLTNMISIDSQYIDNNVETFIEYLSNYIYEYEDTIRHSDFYINNIIVLDKIEETYSNLIQIYENLPSDLLDNNFLSTLDTSMTALRNGKNDLMSKYEVNGRNAIESLKNYLESISKNNL